MNKKGKLEIEYVIVLVLLGALLLVAGYFLLRGTSVPHRTIEEIMNKTLVLPSGLRVTLEEAKVEAEKEVRLTEQYIKEGKYEKAEESLKKVLDNEASTDEQKEEARLLLSHEAVKNWRSAVNSFDEEKWEEALSAARKVIELKDYIGPDPLKQAEEILEKATEELKFSKINCYQNILKPIYKTIEPTEQGVINACRDRKYKLVSNALRAFMYEIIDKADIGDNNLCVDEAKQKVVIFCSQIGCKVLDEEIDSLCEIAEYYKDRYYPKT